MDDTRCHDDNYGAIIMHELVNTIGYIAIFLTYIINLVIFMCTSIATNKTLATKTVRWISGVISLGPPVLAVLITTVEIFVEIFQELSTRGH